MGERTYHLGLNLLLLSSVLLNPQFLDSHDCGLCLLEFALFLAAAFVFVEDLEKFLQRGVPRLHLLHILIMEWLKGFWGFGVLGFWGFGVLGLCLISLTLLSSVS